MCLCVPVVSTIKSGHSMWSPPQGNVEVKKIYRVTSHTHTINIAGKVVKVNGGVILVEDTCQLNQRSLWDRTALYDKL